MAYANSGKFDQLPQFTIVLINYKRFGNAIVSSGTLNLRNRIFAEDFTPIEEDCTCPCCLPTEKGGLGVTKAYMHHITAKETVGAHL